MTELSLQEIKKIEFDILKMFDAFCKANNIRYFLAFGTLLGAVRYKKFIPWDDDVDVLVPREDYEKLIALFKNGDKYRLYSFERDPQYTFPFAKICDMTTKLVEIFYPNSGVELGVYIDVFPLDHFDDNLQKAKKEIRKIRKNNACLSYLKTTGRPRTKNPIKFAFWSGVVTYCKMRGSKHYIRKIIKECNKSEQNESRYVGAKAWPVWGDRIITPAEAFSQTIEIEFEGEMFPAPIGYDTYLTCLYGDYLPEPPKEKQKTHHFFKAYKL